MVLVIFMVSVLATVLFVGSNFNDSKIEDVLVGVSYDGDL